MELSDFLDPVSLDKPEEQFILSPNLFGKHITIHTPNFKPQDLANYQLAILGVPEDRNSFNKGASLAPEKIRAQLYQLYKIEGNVKIIDLGNLKQGNTFNDTYVALREVTQTLIGYNLVVVIIGGTQELTLPAFQAIENNKQSINLTTIDRTIDFLKDSVKNSAETYLNELILRKRLLFKYCNLGHQGYLTDKNNIELISKLFHDAYRLGEIRADISLVEPILRDSDLISLDIGVVRQSDSPGFWNPSPNGLYAEEVCQIARYAGISDRAIVFGIFEANPKFDSRLQTVNLAAQLIWYFIDGFSCRKKEYPAENTSDFKTFIVGHTDLDYEITFYKSQISERWWMKIPKPRSTEFVIISCSYADYLTATNQEVPDLWWKSFQKLS